MIVDKFISHRGVNDCKIENTMPAYQAAKDSGFSWIELDVQMSMDGELFLFHDVTTDRLTDKSLNVASMTLKEILGLKLVHSNMDVVGHVPTFDEYLTWASKNDMYTNVEIKVTKCCKEYETKLANKVIETLDNYPSLKKKLLLSSFSEVVMQIINTNPQYKRSKLVNITNWKESFNRIDTDVYKEFVDNSYDTIIVNYDCLTQKKFEYLKERFGKVLVYSVKTDKHIKKLLKWGADSMFVDKKEYFDIKL